VSPQLPDAKRKDLTLFFLSKINEDIDVEEEFLLFGWI
jgi:hypothetical protein